MRTMLMAIGVVVAVLIVLGLLIKAVKWLLVIGVVALVAGVVQVKRPG